jgi:transcriptional regulator GlxA family with amidase domain
LQQNLHKEIYLDNLDKLTGMSRATLQRHFKSSFGVSPMVYLRNLRLSRASDLLINTNNSLEKIAELSGFENLPYFFKVFKMSAQTAMITTLAPIVMMSATIPTISNVVILFTSLS